MTSYELPKSWFQFHLITALAAMLVASVLVGLNAVAVRRLEAPSGIWLETKGWPWVWWWKGPDLLGGHGRMMEEFFRWRLVLNVLLALALIVMAGALAEWLLRRSKRMSATKQ